MQELADLKIQILRIEFRKKQDERLEKLKARLIALKAYNVQLEEVQKKQNQLLALKKERNASLQVIVKK